VDAYAFCPHGILTGTPDCSSIPRPPSVAIPDALTDIAIDQGSNVFDIRICEIPFSVAVESIEYINAQNMAITVLRAPLTEFSVDTGLLKSDSKVATRKIYFMNTKTMRLGDTPWSIATESSNLAQGTLCPAMRRLPNVGSLSTELIAAGVNAMRPIINLVVSLPGLIQLWNSGRSCSIATHGHSLLQRCGSDIFSLEDAFDSMERANTHFWTGFGIVASRVRDLGENDIADVVDGVAYFGEGTSMAVGGNARSGFVSFTGGGHRLCVDCGDCGGMVGWWDFEVIDFV
jgi:hypothetical protein